MTEDLSVYVETFGKLGVLLDNVVERFAGNFGFIALEVVRWLLDGIGLGEGVAGDVFFRFDGFECFFEALSIGVFEGLDFLGGKFAAFN